MPLVISTSFIGPIAPLAATNDRNAGTEAAPLEGPAKKELATWVLKVPVSVPVPVTGLLVTVKILGNCNPTLDTDPVPVTQVAIPFTVERTEPFIGDGKSWETDNGVELFGGVVLGLQTCVYGTAL
jgi:hypothetical protein